MSARAGRGAFITFEGPEGSGKSVQARRLLERLQGQGLPSVLTREPGGTPLGEELRDILLQRSDVAIAAEAQALILCAARAEHVKQVIRPALARGEVVLCDRFGDSTLAYQGYGHGLSLEALRPVVAFATGGLAPDLTLLLDVPVDEGLARKGRQRTGEPAEWTRFEAETRAFHERVRTGYHALATSEPERWRIFDGRQPIDRLAQQVWEMVAEFLGA